MKKLPILLCSFLIIINSYGQSFSETKLIYLNGFGFKQGDKKLSGADFKKEISKTSIAIPYLKKGKKNAILSSVFFAGSIFFTVASTRNSDHYYTRTSRSTSYRILAGSCFIASAFTLKFALRNKGTAVHLRNLDILKE